MKVQFRKSNYVLSKVSSALYDLPVPPNLTIFWNFGSLLGVCLVLQIMTGVFLACHYTADSSQAFDSVVYIMRDVHNGWFIRSLHANGASFFFICIYIHIGRGIYFHSYNLKKVWLVGCSLLLVLMGIAFTGYVLPWGQMSYWGATVITNLVSAIPIVGQDLVIWIWGDFSVGNASLHRFFVVHFLLPFVLLILVGVHIVFLHSTGSSNPFVGDPDVEVVSFHSLYVLKDLVGIVIMMVLILLVCLSYPDLFSDPVNFVPADPLKTPTHIQPEWYFLFAYAVLRSIPNKLGGVLALAMSVAVFYFLALLSKGLLKGMTDNVLAQVFFWFGVMNFILLSYIGASPIVYPYYTVGVLSSFAYFCYFPIHHFIHLVWESMLLDEGYVSEESGELNSKMTQNWYHVVMKDISAKVL